MMKKILMLSAAVLVFQAVPALAEGPHDKENRGAKMFEKQDANGDGVISEDEFLARAREHFATMDANKDGKVTKEESEAAFAKMREKMKEHREEMRKKHGGEEPPPPSEDSAE
jgi:Ca2+-binding EF-hand superfamily protein